MHKSLLVILLAISLNLSSQNANATKDTVYTSAEQMPQFPGGDDSLNKFLAANMKYPPIEAENNIQGTVYISFILEKDGSLSDIKCVKGVKGGLGLEKEAMRVIKKMPAWIPGKQHDSLVSVKFSVPVKYTIKGVANPQLKDLPVRAKKSIATEYYNEGVRLSQKNDTLGAIKAYEVAIEMNPEEIQALYNSAVLKIQVKDLEGACAELYQIKRLGRHDADELINKYCSLANFHSVLSQNIPRAPIVEINKPFHPLKYIYQGNTITAPHLIRLLNNPSQPEPVLREIKKVHHNTAIKVSLIILGFGLTIPEAAIYVNSISYSNFRPLRNWAICSAPTILVESVACFFATIQKKHNHRVMLQYNQSIN